MPLPTTRFRLRAPRSGGLKPAVARRASEGGSRVGGRGNKFPFSRGASFFYLPLEGGGRERSEREGVTAIPNVCAIGHASHPAPRTFGARPSPLRRSRMFPTSAPLIAELVNTRVRWEGEQIRSRSRAALFFAPRGLPKLFTNGRLKNKGGGAPTGA
jgi:hypothetical protein